MSQQKVTLKAKGIYSFPNLLSEVPSGALLQADNVIINRDGVIESRRGFKLYGNAMGVSATNIAKQLLAYKERIIRHFGSTLQVDNGSGTFTSLSGSYSEVQSGLRIKGIEANGNLYFTTSAGIRKLSATNASSLSTTSVTYSGGIKALDTQLSLNDDGGFLTQDSSVAYRVVWGIKDANNNVILGSPSSRSVITNSLVDTLTADFNNLLTALDTAAPVSPSDDLSDTDYNSLTLSSSAASDIQNGLSSLCTKLNSDLGGGTTKTISSVDTTTDYLTSTSHGLANGTIVSVTSTGTVPGGIDLNANYYIINATTNTFQLSTDNTQNGIVDLVSSGGGTITVYTAPFLLIKNNIDTLVLSVPETSGNLTSLQTYFNDIVNQLNAYIGAVSSPKIDASVSTFDSATESKTVDLNITIPANVTTDHFFQVYRTPVQTGLANALSVGQTGDPGDECQLAYEANPTSTDISNGYVTYHDITPESFLGANLYTNPNSGEGILQANEMPPKAYDLASYKNYQFFANTTTKYRRQFSLLSVSNFVAGTSTITITDGTTTNTYTFDTTEDVATKKVKFTSGDALTPAQQVDETARSLEHVINRNASEIVYAYYLSGPSDVPGLLLLESRTVGGNAFYLNVNNTSTGEEFSPALPTSGNSVIADNEVCPNRVYYSKVNQPEAVPIVNYFDVGPKDKKILRIIGLRESLLIFKEEGIYRLSGEAAPFVINLFDNSTILLAPDSAAVLNNNIYMLSSQGVAQVSDNGVEIISRPIESDLIKLSQYTNYSTASFGVGYESDRTYYLWTVTNRTDTKATQCFRFNTFTRTWTKSTMTSTCAIVNSADDKMYISAGDTNYIEQERKNFDRTDYADREYTFTLVSSSFDGDVITMPSVTNIEERDVIAQIQYLTINQFNRLLKKLDNDNGVNDSDYFETLEAVAGDDLRDKLDSLAAKLDADTSVSDSNYASTISSYTSSFSDTQTAFNAIVNKLNADSGVIYTNYPTSSGTITYEVIIINVDRSSNEITTEYSYPFIAGEVIVYKHIDCIVRWVPEHFGDPSMLKQVSEASIMFDKVSFSEVDLSFATDLNPGFTGDTFTGSGTGIFGSGVFGQNIFGGDSNSIPFRTLVPRDKQRCRYIIPKFEHTTAREAFAIFGLSLTMNTTSQRAYR